MSEEAAGTAESGVDDRLSGGRNLMRRDVDDDVDEDVDEDVGSVKEDVESVEKDAERRSRRRGDAIRWDLRERAFSTTVRYRPTMEERAGESERNVWVEDQERVRLTTMNTILHLSFKESVITAE